MSTTRSNLLGQLTFTRSPFPYQDASPFETFCASKRLLFFNLSSFSNLSVVLVWGGKALILEIEFSQCILIDTELPKMLMSLWLSRSLKAFGICSQDIIFSYP